MFSGCTSLQSITIPDSVTWIGCEAFDDCSNLQSIVIPESVTWIGERAFRGCTKLQTIVIPNSVSNIGEDAFDGCTNLQSISISGMVKLTKTFHYYSSPHSRVMPSEATLCKAFRNCSRLNSIEISDGEIRIGSVIFGGFTRLHSTTIPDSVTEIEQGAFSDCKNLQLITIKTQEKDPNLSRERIEYLLQTISEYSKEISLRVPIGCGYAYRHHPAFEGKFKNIIADIDA